MEIRPRKVIVIHGGTDRVVEIENGPFRIIDDNNEYYEGWVIPLPSDPYGPSYHIVFTADRIRREV